jgi:hypothetical protein
MFTMLFSVIFYAACIGGTWRILLLPLLMVFWVNLHGGFPIGFLVVGCGGAVSLWRRDWRRLGLHLLAALGCLAAIFINPLGWHVYEGLRATLGHFVQAYITEWWPYYRDMAIPGSIPGLLYMMIFLVFELRYRAPCPLEARLLAWIFLGLGLYQFRYMAFFFLFSALPFALGLDRALRGQLQTVSKKALQPPCRSRSVLIVRRAANCRRSRRRRCRSPGFVLRYRFLSSIWRPGRLSPCRRCFPSRMHAISKGTFPKPGF